MVESAFHFGSDEAAESAEGADPAVAIKQYRSRKRLQARIQPLSKIAN